MESYLFKYEVFYTIFSCDIEDGHERGFVRATSFVDAVEKLEKAYSDDECDMIELYVAPIDIEMIDDVAVGMKAEDADMLKDLAEWIKETCNG